MEKVAVGDSPPIPPQSIPVPASARERSTPKGQHTEGNSWGQEGSRYNLTSYWAMLVTPMVIFSRELGTELGLKDRRGEANVFQEHKGTQAQRKKKKKSRFNKYPLKYFSQKGRGSLWAGSHMELGCNSCSLQAPCVFPMSFLPIPTVCSEEKSLACSVLTS